LLAARYSAYTGEALDRARHIGYAQSLQV
jgi:hypothetical protein